MDDTQGNTIWSSPQSPGYNHKFRQVDMVYSTHTSEDNPESDFSEQDYEFLLNKDWELNYYGSEPPKSALIKPHLTPVGKFSHSDNHWWEKNSPDNPLNYDHSQSNINEQFNFRQLIRNLPSLSCPPEATSSSQLNTNSQQDYPKVSNPSLEICSGTRCNGEDSSGRG